MMDILMYLFETYIHSNTSNTEVQLDQTALEDELLDAGFSNKDIYKALTWLEGLSLPNKNKLLMATSANFSTRIYTSIESSHLNVECRGFLLFLEQINILNAQTREIVIDCVMQLETNDFNLEDLKWVVLMVLFNTPENENAYILMEEFLYAHEQGIIH